MQTLFLILILFLISIFSVLLYFKSKTSRLDILNSGECPSCKQRRKVFFDKNSNTNFTQDVIKTTVLKYHGCSGIKDVEFLCTSCGLKEIHSINSQMECNI